MTALVNGILGVNAGPGTPERAAYGVTGSGTRVLFISDFSTTVGGSSLSSFTIDPASGFLVSGTSSIPAPDGASGVLFLQN